MLKTKPNGTTLGGVHTHTHTHTHTILSGYLIYKKIIENIKAHVLYIYFVVPKYI